MRYFIITLTCFCLACQSQNEPSEETVTAESPTAQAQVILKTQTVPFNPEEKSAITTEYEHTKKLEVPTNLVPQNAWVMFEGPVLENELIAYRFYVDTRHRSDIYGKKVNDMVMDTVSWKYHDIMDWGSDILKVGNSLGIGSPAIYYQDEVISFSDHGVKTAEVIANKGPEAAVRFTFNDLKVGEATLTVEQDWSLKVGQPHATVSVRIKEGQLPEGARFATGIVKHLDQATSGTQDGKFYLYTWGQQSYHEQVMGMGILAAEGSGPEIIEDELSHLVVFNDATDQVDYQFMAAWVEDVMQIKDAPAFQTKLVSYTD
ncbi:MAG: DUF4861 family protein [Bacteroidota bacterium]